MATNDLCPSFLTSMPCGQPLRQCLEAEKGGWEGRIQGSRGTGLSQNCTEVWISPQGSKHGLVRSVLLTVTGPKELYKPQKGEIHRQRWRRQVKKDCKDTHPGGPAQHAIPGDHFDGHLKKRAEVREPAHDPQTSPGLDPHPSLSGPNQPLHTTTPNELVLLPCPPSLQNQVHLSHHLWPWALPFQGFRTPHST